MVAAALTSGCGSTATTTISRPAATQTTTTVTETTAKPHKRHRRTLAEEKRAIVGDWTAVGNVLRAKNEYNLIHGDQIGERSWRIGQVCKHHRCRLMFARQTAYAPLVAALTHHGDHWVAQFDQKIPDASGETRIEHSVWRLDLNGPRIAAMERSHTTGNCHCAPSSLVVRWVATR